MNADARGGCPTKKRPSGQAISGPGVRQDLERRHPTQVRFQLRASRSDFCGVASEIRHEVDEDGAPAAEAPPCCPP
jgi:hypothetical protein